VRRTAVYTLIVSTIEGTVTEAFPTAKIGSSRTIEIRGSQTLEQLHRAIFRAFDRYDDCHPHEFHLGCGPHDPDGRRYVTPFSLSDPFDRRPAAGTTRETRLDDLALQAGQ
jgi:hypothetical protein